MRSCSFILNKMVDNANQNNDFSPWISVEVIERKVNKTEDGENQQLEAKGITADTQQHSIYLYNLNIENILKSRDANFICEDDGDFSEVQEINGFQKMLGHNKHYFTEEEKKTLSAIDEKLKVLLTREEFDKFWSIMDEDEKWLREDAYFIGLQSITEKMYATDSLDEVESYLRNLSTGKIKLSEAEIIELVEESSKRLWQLLKERHSLPQLTEDDIEQLITEIKKG